MTSGNKLNNSCQNNGFGLLDSMVALVLLTSIILTIFLFKNQNAQTNKARQLAGQTEVFAAVFARYMNASYTNNESMPAQITLSPLDLVSLGKWPMDLATYNVYHQTPCVAIRKNPVTNNPEAIMYYVDGIEDDPSIIYVSRAAAMYLGGKGGIFLGDKIQGNSGWSISSTSSFFDSVPVCGKRISKNSLAVNMDLFLDWNQVQQSVVSIFRGTDASGGLSNLPGRIRNKNTMKSNLYFSDTTGVVLDATNKNAPLRVTTNNQYGKVLALGDNNSYSLVAGAVLTSGSSKFLESCNYLEVGKIVSDQSQFSNNNLARSTLVCTKNNALCVDGGYCYLPNTVNNIVFRNQDTGVQDQNDQFVCPNYVPYATGIKTNLSNNIANVFVMINTGGKTSPTNSIVAGLANNAYDMKSKSLKTVNLNCPAKGCDPAILNTFLISNNGKMLMEVDLGKITGAPVAQSSFTTTDPAYIPLYALVRDTKVIVGYKVLPYNNNNYCADSCSQLDNVLGGKWQRLGIQSILMSGESVSIVNSGKDAACGCEKVSFAGYGNAKYNYADEYTGLAAITGNPNPIIMSVTCSNMPTYTNE